MFTLYWSTRYLQFEYFVLLWFFSSQNLEDEEKLKGDNALKPLGKINGWRLTEEVYGRGL